jgi:hypothetical protein
MRIAVQIYEIQNSQEAEAVIELGKVESASHQGGYPCFKWRWR